MTGEDERIAGGRRSWLGLALVWAVAAACLALLRYRGDIDVYRRLHVWAAESGLPGWARNLDNEILFVGMGVAIWALMRRLARGQRPSLGLLDDFGLHQGLVRGVAAGVAICLPMLVLGAVTGEARFESRMIRVAIIGPFAEEWFFRAVLVLAMMRLMGVSFLAAAIVGSLMFGAVHVNPWSVDGFSSQWWKLLVTGVGALWFAWMACSWGRNLWLVVTAHALMNLAGTWYGDRTGAAGANVMFEVGRGLTIALGTIMTIEPRWFGMTWAKET